VVPATSAGSWAWSRVVGPSGFCWLPRERWRQQQLPRREVSDCQGHLCPLRCPGHAGVGQGQRDPCCGAPSAAEGWSGHPPLVLRLEPCAAREPAGHYQRDTDSFSGDWLVFCTLSASKNLEACYLMLGPSLQGGWSFSCCCVLREGLIAVPPCANMSGQPLCTDLGQLLLWDPSGAVGNQTGLNGDECLPLHRQLLPSHPGDQRLVLSPRGGPGQDEAPEGGCAAAEAGQRCVCPLGRPRERWQGLEEESASCLPLCWRGAAPSPMAPMPLWALLSAVMLSGHRDPERPLWGGMLTGSAGSAQAPSSPLQPSLLLICGWLGLCEDPSVAAMSLPLLFFQKKCLLSFMGVTSSSHLLVGLSSCSFLPLGLGADPIAGLCLAAGVCAGWWAACSPALVLLCCQGVQRRPGWCRAGLPQPGGDVPMTCKDLIYSVQMQCEGREGL